MSDVLSEEVECEVMPLFSSSLTGRYQMPDGRYIKVHTRQNNGDKDTDKPNCPKLFLDNIWPASYCLADYLVQNQQLCSEKNVLELGAGASLPSCVASCLNARKVVVSDYPANQVVETIQQIIDNNQLSQAIAVAHIWGEHVDDLKQLGTPTGFDTILLADLLWKDTYCQHRQLL